MSANVFEIMRAVAFAERAHRTQKRKYTGEAYIQHPLEVALTVAAIPDISTDAVIAAILHDVVEDCGVTLDTIKRSFGRRVARYVKALTDHYDEEDGNRAERMQLTIKRFANCSDAEVHTIKLADICSNSNSIILEDPGFAKVFMSEKRELLKVLTRGHPSLMARANGLIQQWEFYEQARARNWEDRYQEEPISQQQEDKLRT